MRACNGHMSGLHLVLLVHCLQGVHQQVFNGSPGFDVLQAVRMMERLADEQANVSLHAFGVGRGVDKARCSASMPLAPMDLRPWSDEVCPPAPGLQPPRCRALQQTHAATCYTRHQASPAQT